jgi:D-beta-D-heptose 7-phosphate kinase / D-beta-D-heptose 1-phosphate adenosyltransferase
VGRVIDRAEAVRLAEDLRRQGKTLVFTNGCFDMLHRGHVDLLAAARRLGDALAVGLNADVSVARLKGPDRPWMGEDDRAAILAALSAVDWVILFSEDTPKDLIRGLHPQVLVKGGDYRAEDVVGADTVTADGGRVVIVPLTPDHSSTSLRRRMGAPADTSSGGGRT